MPKISIAIPVHNMHDKDLFLGRCLGSIDKQSFKDYEIVISESGKGMAKNTNEAISKCKGELIKILFMDDFLAHEESLKNIVDSFTPKDNWLVTGCEHVEGFMKRHFYLHFPKYNQEIQHGHNTIGSPSVMTIRNNKPLLFDETMTWLLDCDYYKRMYTEYGLPVILNSIDVVIGIGGHQVTNLLGDDVKQKEFEYMLHKWKK